MSLYPSFSTSPEGEMVSIIAPKVNIFEWVTEGSSSYTKRKELFEHRKAAVKEEIKQLDKTLAMLPDNLPKDIQKLYNKAHK